MKKILLLIATSVVLFANCSAVNQEVEDAKKMLPMKVDKDITATEVYCKNSTMTYVFELSKEQKYGWNNMSKEEISNFKASLKPMLVQQYCKDPDFQTNRTNSVAMQYIYKLEGGKVYADTTIGNKDCK